MHVLIITGGSLDISFARQYIKTLSFDKVFAVDKGLEYAKQLDLIPNCILGDFDTLNAVVLNEYESMIATGSIDSKILKFPPMKDASDTEIALQEAIEQGSDIITILGGTGTRLDHVLANFNILKIAEENKVECFLVDPNNRIQLLDADYRMDCVIEKNSQFGKYVSIMLMTEVVEGLSMKGFVYSVDDANLMQGSSLTVSNEIEDMTGVISLNKGRIWVIESKD